MTNLRDLDLSYNQIIEIKGLENLKALRSLDLSLNQIREISGLENLRKLGTLELYHNQIADLRGLEHLSELFFVSLEENNILPEILQQCIGEKDVYSAAANYYPVDAQKCVNYCRKASNI